MSVYLDHKFKDGTGIRIVDVPNEQVKREIPEVQFRISGQGEKTRLAKCPLFDFETEEDLFEELKDSILQLAIKEVGKQCGCGRWFLPTSPNQKNCPDCMVPQVSKED